MAGNDAAVFHFVDPIARISDEAVVGDQEQRFLALAHEIGQ